MIIHHLRSEMFGFEDAVEIKQVKKTPLYHIFICRNFELINSSWEKKTKIMDLI